MDADAFRTAAHAAIEQIIEYNNSLPDKRVLANVQPGYLRPQLPSEAPTDPQPWNAIQPDIEKLIVPGLTHWQSPNFMAFFPATTTYPSLIGEMYSAAFTAPAFNWECSPVCTELETVVLDWMANMMGLPQCFLSQYTDAAGNEVKSAGGGVIQGTASEAVVVAMVAARERVLRSRSAHLEGEEREDYIDSLRGKLVAMGSDQSHSSTQKATQIAGTKHHSITTSAENHFSLTGRDVRAAVKEIVAKGRIPFYLTVTLGTTSTCAVDHFAEIADVLKDYPDVWVHVDAAYAGAALICPEYQHHAKDFDKYDSFSMNMHKWLLVNFDANLMYIRHRTHLTTAMAIARPYLDNEHSAKGLVTDYRDWQIPLGRRFRALKIWFVIRSYGIELMRKHIRNGIQLGETFAKLVKSRADLFTLVEGPAFGLVVFAIKPKKGNTIEGAMNALKMTEAQVIQKQAQNEGLVGVNGQATPPAVKGAHAQDAELKAANAATDAVYKRVNARGPIYLTAGSVGGPLECRSLKMTSKGMQQILAFL